MTENSKSPFHEETLDPEDWERTRKIGHRMVDDVIDYLANIRQRSPWTPIPDKIKANFSKPLPLDPESLESVYSEFTQTIMPYPMGNIHPRFWGWILGTGTVTGAFAEFLSGAMNTNTGGGSHAANYVEKQVIDWIKEIMSYPPHASGVLTSGCSAANLIGLAVARNTMATRNVRKRGLSQDSKRMVLYASEEIHSSVQKAVELMGLGNDSLRRIKVDERFQICIDDLKDAISDDRKNGNNPFCIIGAAGTTNTGSIDDLSAISDLCKREELWFHVDGAFGAWAVLDPAMKQRLKGLEQADSLALDLHKWMYMPYEIGCILVRREEFHRETFSLTPDYLAHDKDMRGISGGELSWFSDYDIQLSRSFKALKTWMCLKEHGVKRYSRLIQQNISQINYLADLIKRHYELELVAPVCLNVACFRFVVPELSEEKLNRINERIVIELQERGIAVLTGTIIKGKYALRAANTNHRSQREDFKFLVDEIIRLGKELTT